jgi:drug/metabolite transporter (DMT)-like permease
MQTAAFLAVLLSAVLHASWNAIARSGHEPGDVLATGVVLSGGVGIIGVLCCGWPASASWPWLITGVIINTIGIRLAMAAYRVASFGLTYPTMRAGIPLLTLPAGAILLSEWPRPIGVAGVLLIAAALLMLALAARHAGRSEMRGLILALMAAVAGAGYVTADAVGVRLAGNVFGYAFLVSIGNALALSAVYGMEGRNLLKVIPQHITRGTLISTLSMTSFLLYMWAVASSPVALTAALRETSVLFAVAIAYFVLGESITRYHWAAASLALAGVVAIRLA